MREQPLGATGGAIVNTGTGGVGLVPAQVPGGSAHVTSLTSLRGVASLFVLMLHALLFFRVDGVDVQRELPAAGDGWAVSVQKLLLILFSGDAAVTLFFVLSGCVLAMSLERRPALDWSTVRQFYLRRFFRIYPALWLSCLMGLVTLWMVLRAGPSPLTTDWMRHEYAHRLSLADVLECFAGLRTSLNQPIWSILIELVFSVLFPIIFLLARRPLTALLGLAGSLVLLFAPLDVRYELNIHVLPFMVGAVLPRVVLPAALERGLAPWWRPLGLLGAALVILPRGLLLPLADLKSVCILLEVTGSTILIFALLRGKLRLRTFDRPTARFLGDISYSIYLLHFPILFVLGTGLVAMAPGWIAAHGLAAGLLLAALTILATIPVAAASYRFVELPGQRLAALVERPYRATVGDRLQTIG